MANKSKFQAIKGTRDLLPPETTLWNRVERTAHEVFGTFAFGEIRLPLFEPTELFSRSIGLDTDVVSKEMYSWVDNAVPRLGSLADVVIS
jgi:histidyl-tRNA synthetase